MAETPPERGKDASLPVLQTMAAAPPEGAQGASLPVLLPMAPYPPVEAMLLQRRSHPYEEQKLPLLFLLWSLHKVWQAVFPLRPRTDP